ncbi:methyltransferase domain-containing protein [Amnibacterium sp.]|uniref:methyltransferase domain-containing protein n=1 Tax=Amnibacterium sp. TaxID=1872496 RepID=UPI003F7B93B2
MEDATIRAYQERADAYLAADREPPEPVLAWQRRFAAIVGAGGTVLARGSGPGRDADRLEGFGLRVLRSDATPAFTERLRAMGHDVLDLDVRRDPIPEVDGVFVNAVLLHLDRAELADALQRIRAALRPHGAFACSLKEGDGEEWHDRKLGRPRRFVYWRAAPLRAALEQAGFAVLAIEHIQGGTEPWLQVLARPVGQRARGCAVV